MLAQQLDQAHAKIDRALKLLIADNTYTFVGDETRGVLDMMLSAMKDIESAKAALQREATGK